MKELSFEGGMTRSAMLGMVIRLGIPAFLAEMTTVMMEYIDAGISDCTASG